MMTNMTFQQLCHQFIGGQLYTLYEPINISDTMCVSDYIVWKISG